MNRHPGGEEHSRHMIALAGLAKASKWLDMGAGAGETVRLLRTMGYEACGIDLHPGSEDVMQGDYLAAPYDDGSFDGIISQCSFYVSGDVPRALQEAGRLLRKGGKLVFSDVTEDAKLLMAQCCRSGFAVQHTEDLTPAWREYYLEALWTQENVCLPHGKKFRYVLCVCERM